MGKASRRKAERRAAKLVTGDDMLALFKAGCCIHCGQPRQGGATWCRSCTAAGRRHAIARMRSPRTIDFSYVRFAIDYLETLEAPP